MGNSFARAGRRMRHILPCTVCITVLFIISGFLATAVAADDFGPLMTVDRLVAERGATVTIALNAFPANGNFVLAARPTLSYDPNAVAALVPVTTDTRGFGTVGIPTAGLANGNYIVSVANTGSNDPLFYVLTAFGVIDPGTAGPRVVRAVPLPPEDHKD